MILLRLDDLLKARGRTAYWLGKETGINHATISQLRNGKLKAIRFDYIEKICEALDCEPGELIVRTKERAPGRRGLEDEGRRIR